MLRAIALAARLDFTIEPTLLAAIRTHRHEIAKSAAPRVLEELYKILRAGSAERAFRSLAAVGILELTAPELDKLYNVNGVAVEGLWRSLAALDAYRRRFESTPETLTNTILLGTLLVPIGVPLGEQDARGDVGATPRLGSLPLARKDIERLRQILGLQRRLRDSSASVRAQRALVHRHIFREAMTWLEIHGHAPALVEHWRALAAEVPESGAGTQAGQPAEESVAQPFGRRRRRRRRRRLGLR